MAWPSEGVDSLIHALKLWVYTDLSSLVATSEPPVPPTVVLCPVGHQVVTPTLRVPLCSQQAPS